MSLQSRCQDKLKLCCESYILQINQIDTLRRVSQLALDTVGAGRLEASVCDQYPLLMYALENVLYHANEAAGFVAQHDFLTKFNLAAYIDLLDYLPSLIYKYGSKANMVYVLAEQGHSRLVKAVDGHTAAQQRSDGRYLYPILACLVNRDLECAHVLLPHCDKVALQKVVSSIHLGRTFIPPDRGTLIDWAMARRYDSLAVMLVSSPFHQIGEGDETNLLLCKAVINNCARLVEKLLEEGANVNANFGNGPVLSQAVQAGNEEIVKILLGRGATVDDQAGSNRILHEAIIAGHEKAVRLLLEKGANVNAQSDRGTALFEAVDTGNERLVRMLLDRGAETNAQGQ